MVARGNVVEVRTQEDYEKMLAQANSVSGWFEPSQAYGEVTFTTPAAAVAARGSA